MDEFDVKNFERQMVTEWLAGFVQKTAGTSQTVYVSPDGEISFRALERQVVVRVTVA